MNNKRIKRWQNIDKLYAECTYKQVIQKSRTECLKGIVYTGCRRKCVTVFLKFGIVSQSLVETKTNVEVPQRLANLSLEANLVLWVCISEARVRARVRILLGCLSSH